MLVQIVVDFCGGGRGGGVVLDGSGQRRPQARAIGLLRERRARRKQSGDDSQPAPPAFQIVCARNPIEIHFSPRWSAPMSFRLSFHKARI